MSDGRPLYGSGTKTDPYRDTAKTDQLPPGFIGSGTKTDPYRNAAPAPEKKAATTATTATTAVTKPEKLPEGLSPQVKDHLLKLKADVAWYTDYNKKHEAAAAADTTPGRDIGQHWQIDYHKGQLQEKIKEYESYKASLTAPSSVMPKVPPTPTTARTAPTDTKKPETPTTPTKEPTRLEALNKKWEFWQGQHASWENDRLAPADQYQRNMVEASQKIAELKRDFAGIGKTPPPDRTAPQYLPQTPQQQKAMNNYNNYQKAMDELRQAESNQRKIRQTSSLDSLTSFADPSPATRAEAASNRQKNDKADQDLAQAQAKVNQLNEHWQNSGHQAKYGSLPNQKTTAPDPTHTPNDPRKPQRTVDPMEYKIKSTR